MLHITDHQRNANKTTVRYHCTLTRMVTIKKKKKQPLTHTKQKIASISKDVENWESQLVHCLWM